MASTRQTSFRLHPQDLANLDELAQLLTDELERSLGHPSPYPYNRTMALRYAVQATLEAKREWATQLQTTRKDT